MYPLRLLRGTGKRDKARQIILLVVRRGQFPLSGRSCAKGCAALLFQSASSSGTVHSGHRRTDTLVLSLHHSAGIKRKRFPFRTCLDIGRIPGPAWAGDRQQSDTAFSPRTGSKEERVCYYHEMSQML